MDSAEERQPDRQHNGNDDIITNHNCFPFFRLNSRAASSLHLSPTPLLLHTFFSFCRATRVCVQRGVYPQYWTSETDVRGANRDFMFRQRFDLFRCCLFVPSDFQRTFAIRSVSDALFPASIHFYVESRERGCVLRGVGPLLARRRRWNNNLIREMP